MFVESFQGQYRDGTNGTRDFRMVSASFLILEFFVSIILGSTLLLLVPHLVLICYVCYALAKNVGITHCLKRKYDRCVQANRHTNQAETDVETESDCGLLPDRLINPEECCMNHSYPPQKNTRVEHTRNQTMNTQED